jgi:hypothetical protein
VHGACLLLLTFQCGSYIYCVSFPGARAGNSRKSRKLCTFKVCKWSVINFMMCILIYSLIWILFTCLIVKHMEQMLKHIPLWHTEYMLERKKHSAPHWFQYMKQEWLMRFSSIVRMRILDRNVEKVGCHNYEVLWSLLMLQISDY